MEVELFEVYSFFLSLRNLDVVEINFVYFFLEKFVESNCEIFFSLSGFFVVCY